MDQTSDPMNSPTRVVVLISGSGTTLLNLIQRVQTGRLDLRIAKVVSSQPDAGGLKHAQAAAIEHTVVDRRSFQTRESFSDAVFEHCRAVAADFVAMGGFLKQVTIPSDFENRVVNIHPSLIPAFCGRGYYGLNVHRAVLDYGCKISGCTVHFVDNEYDHGPIIAQRAVAVHSDDTPQSLAARVFEQECELYPEVLQALVDGRINADGRRVTWNR